jgi:RNA polymerase sigma-70 factor (ECF subfamily)
MNSEDRNQRLSRIATRWSEVAEAHAGPADVAAAARQRLMLRYCGAAYRYLLGAVRDADAADDLCQEFAVRFLRGDFRRADPDRGRFRDYIKTVLVNLVNDYHHARQARPQPLDTDAPEPLAAAESSLPPDAAFDSSWRQELLDKTWTVLAAANPAYHAALWLRAESPEMPSAEMAARLTAQLGKSVTPENVRKLLQRAHAKFADLLLDEVAASLDSPTAAEMEAELKVLDLLRYCRSALERRGGP